MALLEVISYMLIYDEKKEMPSIKITIKDGTSQKTRELKILPLHMGFVVDMLRNEKPVFYSTTSESIQTGAEMVGEEEGK